MTKALELDLEAYISDPTDDTEVHSFSEFQPLFGDHHNPNRDIFVVPTQAGSDEDDQGHGSIGDATMEHVTRQRHHSLELEHFIHMPNGNIMRTENNVSPPDETGTRASKRNIVELLNSATGFQGRDPVTKKARTYNKEDCEALIQFFNEEMEETARQREERADALDQVLVPFEDWEAMPQMTSVIDIPSTPTPMYIYAGNSSQMFYDWVTEDHPDLKLINTFLSMANAIDWDKFNLETVEYFDKWLFDGARAWQVNTVPEILIKLCNDIALATVETPSDLAIKALRRIESDWRELVHQEAITKFYNDPVMKELVNLHLDLEDKAAAGKLVWSDLGKVGKQLYTKIEEEMKLHQETNPDSPAKNYSAIWSFYKKLKQNYAPTLVVNKIDLNRAPLDQLINMFKLKNKEAHEKLWNSDISDEQFDKEVEKLQNEAEYKAKNVFFARPFRNLEEVALVNGLSIDDITGTKNTTTLISSIKKAYRESYNLKNLHALSRLATQIVDLQRQNPNMCTEQEWFSVWQVYRFCKAKVTHVAQK